MCAEQHWNQGITGALVIKEMKIARFNITFVNTLLTQGEHQVWFQIGDQKRNVPWNRGLESLFIKSRGTPQILQLVRLTFRKERAL